MSQLLPPTQELYSQETQTQTTPQSTPQTPTTPGGTGFSIPVHCGLLTLKSDLNKIHIDIKKCDKGRGHYCWRRPF